MRKFLILFVLIIGCLGTGYFASSMLYLQTISNFAQAKVGEIQGTKYSFMVEHTSGLVFYIRNKNQQEYELLKAQRTGLKYTVLDHLGAQYLILKNTTGTIGVPYSAYYVWNITGDKPYFVNSTSSCNDPKLIGNHLEFDSYSRCDTAGLFRHDESIIDLH
jgi:hypothetical protein